MLWGMVCLLLLLVSTPGQALTRYVNQATGNDVANDCSAAQNPSTPKATMNAGLACMAGGDTLEIAAGTYPECLKDHGPIALPLGSSWAAPTIIKAQAGHTVWLRRSTQCDGVASLIDLAALVPHYVVFDGINLNGVTAQYNCAVAGLGTTHLRFQNSEAKHCAQAYQGAFGASEFLNLHVHHQGFDESLIHVCPDPALGCHGLYIAGPDNLLDTIITHDNTGMGITLSCEGCGAQVVNNVVRRTKAFANGAAGIFAYTGNLVYSSIAYENYVGLWGAATFLNNTVINNNNGTFYEPASIGIFADGGEVRNNITLGQLADIHAPGGPGSISSNLCGSVDGSVGCTVAGTPSELFVDPSTDNYHLLTGTAAVNSGLTLPAVPMDYDSVPRVAGAYDLGALEFTSGVAAAVRFVQEPTSSATATAIVPPITVEVVDAAAIRVTSSTATITLALGANPGGSLLSGDASNDAVAGLATFPGLSLDQPGVGYTLTATSGVLTGDTSAAFTIFTPLAPGLGPGQASNTNPLAVYGIPVTNAPVTREHPLLRGAKAWWRGVPGLDGGNKVWDLLGNAYADLVNMTGASGWKPTLREGGSTELRLGGLPAVGGNREYLTVGTRTGVTGPFGVAFQLTGLAPAAQGSTYTAIMGQTGAGEWGEGWGLYTTSFDEHLYCFVEHYLNAAVSLTVFDPSTRWRHIACTWDGAVIRLFIDGVPQTDFAYSGAISTGNALEIGRLVDPEATWKGAVDDILLWGRAIAPWEVGQHLALSRQGMPEVLQRTPILLAPFVSTATPRVIRRAPWMSW